MDDAVKALLDKEGFDTSLSERVIPIPVMTDDEQRPLPLGRSLTLLQGEKPVMVELKDLSALFVGTRQPPSFAKGPTPEYVLLFAMIELTAVQYCQCTGRLERDEEIARLYNHLRRRPDGTDDNPLFSYLQGAARLYLSLKDVSRAEFEAMAHRLHRSARHFETDAASSNYIEQLAGAFNS
ncbi:MAG: hypothetical protein HY901_37910 [Deltaproteobacteria bacterium]|nr:hypothetical protein [Deltaproteobacteria bacterium]